ncbi:MlaD family protein [Geoalkalibacter sp.]|jgi:paraquat-inducible protein B|uniref:MlaD family protein n=1 Tax=Geoalkalibacter sp. TaxID=3041440 RepID=UPI00272E6A65|nr:MlaD family protein [Geoalkalibacter sp.]
MSKKANPALVGAFVLGALALVVTAVIIFGGGHFFRPTERYMLYFEGSVKGLNVGAPVMFRGVQVGSVVEIRIEFDESDLSFRIPVTIEVLPDRFTQVCCENQGTNRPLEIGTQEFIDLMVAQGLRAQLQSQSFVTGQLLVLIDLFPERPPRFAEVETPYPQLPTIPSGFEELTRTLEELPLAEIAHKLVATLEGIEQFVRSPQLGETLRGVGETLEEVKNLVGGMEGRLDRADRELSATLKTTRDLLTHLDGRLQPLADQWGQTAQAGQEALEETRRVMAALGETLGEESLLHVQLERALGELAGAARALRDLSEYLERHPDALLRGKGGTSP